ncbi:MAG: site-specific integrase [Acidobacteriaceae bacterium]
MNSRSRGTGRIFSRKGSTVLWCAYYLRGKEYRESTGESDPIRAEKYLKHRLKEVGADQIGAKPFIGPKQERMKISELLNALEADYKLRGKDSPQFRAHLKHIREYFGAWRALEVTAEAVDKYIIGRQDTGTAAATINRSTQLLNQAFSFAVKNKHLSTVPRIRHLSEKGNARQGFFNDADFHVLSGKLPSYLHDFTRFGYLTGWRKGEIASLRWEDVDSDAIRLRAENAKNGEGRTVTLEGELGELIERRKAERKVKTKKGVMLAAWVFHNDGEPIGDFRKAWATACIASGLGSYRCSICQQPVAGHRCEQCNTEAKYSGRIFHDFRRTAVRNMVRAGVPERVAMTISGHKTRSIFDRYNIVNEADLREAMQRTQSYLKGSAQREDAPVVMRQAGGKN